MYDARCMRDVPVRVCQLKRNLELSQCFQIHRRRLGRLHHHAPYTSTPSAGRRTAQNISAELSSDTPRFRGERAALGTGNTRHTPSSGHRYRGFHSTHGAPRAAARQSR
jgi:hypothetical protein